MRVEAGQATDNDNRMRVAYAPGQETSGGRCRVKVGSGSSGRSERAGDGGDRSERLLMVKGGLAHMVHEVRPAPRPP